MPIPLPILAFIAFWKHISTQPLSLYGNFSEVKIITEDDLRVREIGKPPPVPMLPENQTTSNFGKPIET